MVLFRYTSLAALALCLSASATSAATIVIIDAAKKEGEINW
jgi:hypothetical protein